MHDPVVAVDSVSFVLVWLSSSMWLPASILPDSKRGCVFLVLRKNQVFDMVMKINLGMKDLGPPTYRVPNN